MRFTLVSQKRVCVISPCFPPKLDEKNDIETITNLYENNMDISRINDPHDESPFRRSNNLPLQKRIVNIGEN